MPHFAFTFEPSQAGCVERVCLFTPWDKQARAPNGAVVQPAEQAWTFLQQYAQQRDQSGNPLLTFTPGCKIGCTCINPGGQGQQPNVYCVQKADPYVGRAQVNAPWGAPVASGVSLAPPPLPGQPGAARQGCAPQGMYDDLGDSALALTGDSVFGEVDGYGGTYTDVDSQGREVKREIAMPFPQKVTGR